MRAGGSPISCFRIGRDFACLILLLCGLTAAEACVEPASVCETAAAGSFGLVEAARPAAILVDADADSAVRHAVAGFRADLKRVSGHDAALLTDRSKVRGLAVVVGVLGRSPIIDGLAASGKIDVRDIAGQWEAFRQVVVDHPWPGVARALVIVGADRRGAAFGTYDLSERIGVSPWHWFADVPVRHRENVYVTAGTRSDRPRVRYRGFFINDEDPAFSGWAKQQFGGVNSKAYAKVFELLLRLKGNYLWPAMWAPKSFALDDPRNIPLADEMGVVMGTSHHEPLTRAQSEWHRLRGDGVAGGRWDYRTNAANLRAFWRGGIERMMSKGGGQAYENVVTVGMRGDGDEPMAETTATELLETIVADQRKIIADVTGRPAERTPQVWALYKEVQDYYDHGMRVPDDVTLLFSDDNWGQIRRLPDPSKGDVARSGGYGVYYHFDYVGGPRNYKWINTNQVGKIWQQMDLAYARGARQLWVVNVGDIKPMEYPLDFFLKMAWNPEAMTAEALGAFPTDWGAATFGPDLAAEIGSLMTTYSRYAARRKPELLDQDSFALGPITGDALDGGEFGEIIEGWRALASRADAVRARLRPDQQSAWFQFAGYPIAALSNLYELYYAAAWNKALASRNDPRANYFADQVEATFARDAALTAQYHALNGGKWDGMMNQVHMSYVIWNDPTRQTMPSIMRVGADTPPEERGVQPRFRRAATDQGRRIVLDAADFQRAVPADGVAWRAIADLGQGKGALVSLPQGGPPSDSRRGPRVEYDVTTGGGDTRITLRLAPTLGTTGAKGLRIGISVDDRPVQILSSALIPTPGAATTPEQTAWIAAVIANAHEVSATFPGLRAGRHTIKVWRIDDNVVVDAIAVSPAEGTG
ncbi:hypothetical protein ETR14_08390 [Sphingosinicella sp. BN140058]|nr:hypothetical protein ETR14_08390 [Sphingosinicella sp. BN140058]